jgi:hypothetical protein
MANEPRTGPGHLSTCHSPRSSGQQNCSAVEKAPSERCYQKTPMTTKRAPSHHLTPVEQRLRTRPQLPQYGPRCPLRDNETESLEEELKTLQNENRSLILGRQMVFRLRKSMWTGGTAAAGIALSRCRLIATQQLIQFGWPVWRWDE